MRSREYDCEAQRLGRRAIDFSDVGTEQRLPCAHPDEILRGEFLRPLGLSVCRLARALKISRPRLNDVVLGGRGVCTDTGLRLGRYFGTTPEFWVNLQLRNDLDVSERTLRLEIEREIELPATNTDLVSAERAGAA